MIQIAGLVSARSTCKRAHVGAVVTDQEMMTVIAMGYNGAARSRPNRCERNTPGDCGCVHAEANAIIKAPFFDGPLILFCTHTPCEDCAKLILNSRVGMVYAYNAYRLTKGVEILLSAGVQVMIWDDGKFIEWDKSSNEKATGEG